MTRLADKRIVITGGAGGIGSVTAKRFAEEGARLFLTDTDRDALEALKSEIGADQVSCCVADVSKAEDVQNYVNEAVTALGGIDGFLNNAGVEGDVALTHEYSIETFDKLMAVNVRGAWLGMKYVMPQMHASGGSIVITSSVAGQMGTPGISPYTMSKHAMVGLMRTCALEGAEYGIRVNTVHPGPIHTRMIYSLEEQHAPSDPMQARRSREQRIPMHRYGQPIEIANMMLFLASDESSYCTGATYMADGGQSAL